MISNKMNKRALIGVGIGVLCLYLALRGIHVHEVWRSLAQADYRWMLPAAVIYSLGFLLRTWRWRALLSPLGSVANRRLFAFLTIGFLANNLLPLRAGELVRAHLAGTRMRISRSATLATVLVERTCDGLSFAVLFVITTWFLPFPPVLKRSAWILAILCVTAFIVFHRASHAHSQGRRLNLKLPWLPERWRNTVTRIGERFQGGFAAVRQPRQLGMALGLSFVIWLGEGLTLYLASQAFSLGLSYLQAWFVLFAIGLAVTLPQAPGYVGSYELFGTTALAFWGIPKLRAVPFILALHAFHLTVISLWGIWGLFSEGLSLNHLRSDVARGE